jgi:DNA-binding PadR family transcriptional regulator
LGFFASRGVVISIFAVRVIPESREFKKLEERIVKKSLDIILLRLIEQKPMNGYALILCVRKKFLVSLSAGTVYSLLESLERKGLIEGHNRENKLYTLSKKGERTLGLLRNMQMRIRAINQEIFEASLLLESRSEKTPR